MRTFETELTLRHINPFKLNGYDIHAAVEKAVFEDTEAPTQYVFSSLLDADARQVKVLVRTSHRTQYPGERESIHEFKNGDYVKFAVRFVPLKNVKDATGKTRQRFIRDSIDRELKFHGYAERAGLDVLSVEEVEITSTNFAKGKRPPFGITDVTLIVEAHITDKREFELAYASGLGKKVTFGYGYIHLLEHANV
ncbi:type I-E CRISPR-associated protein Cas6/Cse3/CasE [Vibrio breoganii]